MPAKRSQDKQGSSTTDSSSTFGNDLASQSDSSGKSPEEIRETVKEAVGKGVAAVAGVADGINETMEETRLDETAEQAIRQVGETTTKVVSAARETVDDVRSAVKGRSSSFSGDEGIGLSESYGKESSLASGAALGASTTGTAYGSSDSPVSEPYALASQEEE